MKLPAESPNAARVTCCCFIPYLHAVRRSKCEFERRNLKFARWSRHEGQRPKKKKKNPNHFSFRLLFFLWIETSPVREKCDECSCLQKLTRATICFCALTGQLLTRLLFVVRLLRGGPYRLKQPLLYLSVNFCCLYGTLSSEFKDSNRHTNRSSDEPFQTHLSRFNETLLLLGRYLVWAAKTITAWKISIYALTVRKRKTDLWERFWWKEASEEQEDKDKILQLTHLEKSQTRWW